MININADIEISNEDFFVNFLIRVKFDIGIVLCFVL